MNIVLAEERVVEGGRSPRGPADPVLRVGAGEGVHDVEVSLAGEVRRHLVAQALEKS